MDELKLIYKNLVEADAKLTTAKLDPKVKLPLRRKLDEVRVSILAILEEK